MIAPSPAGLYRQAADGTGKPLRLTSTDARQSASSWIGGGQWLLFSECNSAGEGCDLWQLQLGNEPIARRLWESAANERGAAVSPDGRWLSYLSDVSGEYHVYVRPYPNVEDGRWQVSIDGVLQGSTPMWSADGNEILYVAASDASSGASVRRTMMAVPVESGASFEAGVPRRLFEITALSYASVGPDGRILVAKRVDEKQQIVQNWFDELERLVPTK